MENDVDLTNDDIALIEKIRAVISVRLQLRTSIMCDTHKIKPFTTNSSETYTKFHFHTPNILRFFVSCQVSFG